MDFTRAEISRVPIKEALVPVWPPTTGRDQLSIQIIQERDHIDSPRIKLEPEDLVTQGGRCDFIAVNRQNPIIAGERDRHLVGATESREWTCELMEAHVTELRCDRE